MENIKTMRLFLQVVQAGSLSGASRQSGLSPASVSRQITALRTIWASSCCIGPPESSPSPRPDRSIWNAQSVYCRTSTIYATR